MNTTNLESLIRQTYIEAVNTATEDNLLDLAFWLHNNGYPTNKFDTTKEELLDLINTESFYHLTIFLDKLVEMIGQ